MDIDRFIDSCLFVLDKDPVDLIQMRCIFNKHIFLILFQKYPPRKDLVRAVSLMTGYLIKPTGPKSCTFTYLSQADPRGMSLCSASFIYIGHLHCFLKIFFFVLGSLPKWVVNKASQVLAPKVSRHVCVLCDDSVAVLCEDACV